MEPEVYMMMPGVSGVGGTGSVSSGSAFLPRVSTFQNDERTTSSLNPVKKNFLENVLGLLGPQVEAPLLRKNLATNIKYIQGVQKKGDLRSNAHNTPCK